MSTDLWDRRVAVADAKLTPEVRDPSGATRLLTYQPPGLPMTYEWNADTAVREGFLANVVAFRCVQIIANTIASLPFRAGPDIDDKAKFDKRAPLAQLLGPAPGGPAPKLSARKLWAWTIAQRLVTGRHAWELDYGKPNTGRVQALWPLVAARLDAVPTQGGTEWFSEFRYGPSHDPVRLPADRVFYGWDPHPEDFRQPMSALMAARYDLSIAIQADRYSWSFLRNGSVPAAVVITGKFPDETTKRRFQQQWDARYRGPANAGKTAFHEVEEGATKASDAIHVQTLGLAQKDAQFLEQHRAALEMVAIDLGVPWSKLDASGRTFANAEAEEETFWENTILPLVATLEDEVNLDLAPRVGSDAGWFDVSGVRALRKKVTPVTQAVGVDTLTQARLMTVNEARADYGLPAVEGGDRMMTVDEITALKGGLRPTVEREAPEPETRTPEPAPVETRTVDQEERRAALWSRTDRQATILEARWERAFKRLFTRQETSTLRRLEGNRGRKVTKGETRDAGAVFDPEFWKDETRQAGEDLYEQVVASSLAQLSEDLGVSFDVFDPAVVEFIEGRANQLAGQVTDTTYRALTEALAEGAQEGESIPELARRVRDVFEDATNRRATVIARTEVISAFNGAAATQASLLPADVVAGQEWIATRDGRTRPAHASADGLMVPIGEPFPVGGDNLAYPGDPAGRAANTVQCRCTVAFLTPDEWPQDSERVSAKRAAAVLSLIQPGHKVEPRVLRAALGGTP